MNRLLVFSTLLSVIALSSSSLPNNRYGVPHSRNSLSHQGRYPSAPHTPNAPHPPRTPVAPRAPHSSHSFGAPRNTGYGGHQAGHGFHQSAPRASVHQSSHRQSSHYSAPNGHQAAHGIQHSALGPYAGARHFGSSGPSVNHYSGPSHVPGPLPYSGPIHASAGSSHYSSAKRSVYDQPQESYGSNSRSGFPNQQNYGHQQQHAQSQSTAHGREMKYTIRDPHNRGTTHVSETHVVSNRQMHGAEAEAAMKKLMGSMGSSGTGGFDDFFKGMGLPFY